MRDFRGLLVWQKSHALALAVRRQTRRFPRRGYASFISQLIRAAESVPFNIVEGCGAASQKDFARYLDNSIKSANELEYQLQLALDNNILPNDRWRALTDDCIEVRKMLYGLRRKILDDGA
jgi:four helix bundle protein